MTSAAIQIDLDLLDELLENQKKLDDLFLDDDLFLTSSVLTEDTPDKVSKVTKSAFEDNYIEEDLSYGSDDFIFEEKTRNPFASIVLVLLEVVAIYYSISYFS